MALPVALLIVGCASGKDELTKQVEQMSAQLRELRAATLTAQDRLDALEEPRGPGGADNRREDAEGEAGAAGRPSLEVVRLSPTPDGQQALDDDPMAMPEPEEEDTGPRPLVRANGKGGSVDERGSKPQGATGSRRPMARSK
jgi:hypothetical protein